MSINDNASGPEYGRGRTAEILEGAYPDESLRKALIEILAKVIEVAHEAAPASWELSLRRRFLRLNVGQIVVMELGREPGRVGITLPTEGLDEKTAKWVEKAGDEVALFRAVENTCLLRFKAEEVVARRRELEPFHHDVTRRAAEKMTSSPFKRFHNPGAVAYFSSVVGRDLPRPAHQRLSAAHKIEQLLDRFTETYVREPAGEKHRQQYVTCRSQGQANFEGVTAASDRGEDVTDAVLLKLLPHADTAANRDRGAWVSWAPAVTKDVKEWFEGAGWAKPGDWPAISRAILDFAKRCATSPGDLQAACEAFARDCPGKGFQAGLLSPILNALRPNHFVLINRKSRALIEFLSGQPVSSALVSYPATNALGLGLLEQLRPALEAHGVPELSPLDVMDMFAHWLVSVEKVNLGRPRYWKIAPGEGAWNWEVCRDKGFIAIGWDELGDLSEVGRAGFDERVERLSAPPPDGRGYTRAALAQVWRFAHIAEGDWVVANRGTTEVLGLGRVTGPYWFVPGVRHGHRLPVEWEDTKRRRVSYTGWRRTLIELDRAAFDAIRESPGGDQPAPPTDPPIDGDPVDETVTNPPYPLSEWAAETGLDEGLLAQWARAIDRKGQVVFYGPPGTGKTFMAERLASHLLGLDPADGFREIVQFHPAYAYEDFVQGIRPIVGAAGMSYELAPGRLLDFCERASRVEGLCVLIIDEINRAHLSRVFGELMYLLEYRDESVPLAGGGRRFSIPANVRIIGTMNTADRSIALVDHALRRRFAFLELRPHYEAITHFHAKQETGFDPTGLIAVLRRLNAAIGNRHYEIGISFFTRADLATQVEDIWRMEIEPYLEEQFFDREAAIEGFRWESVGAEILG